jgi:hypothetical protein
MSLFEQVSHLQIDEDPDSVYLFDADPDPAYNHLI